VCEQEDISTDVVNNCHDITAFVFGTVPGGLAAFPTPTPGDAHQREVLLEGRTYRLPEVLVVAERAMHEHERRPGSRLGVRDALCQSPGRGVHWHDGDAQPLQPRVNLGRAVSSDAPVPFGVASFLHASHFCDGEQIATAHSSPLR
jgi:hypothetical protein